MSLREVAYERESDAESSEASSSSSSSEEENKKKSKSKTKAPKERRKLSDTPDAIRLREVRKRKREAVATASPSSFSSKENKKPRVNKQIVIDDDEEPIKRANTPRQTPTKPTPKSTTKTKTKTTPAPTPTPTTPPTITPRVICEDGTECFVSNAAFYNNKPGQISKALKKALSCIMHQDEAIEAFLFQTFPRIASPLRDLEAAFRILNVHLTGGSGIGKTQSAKEFARAIGVGPGTQYPNNLHSINLGKYSDASHGVAVTGAALGLVGYNDQNLVTILKKMADGSPGAPFLVLHLDEVDKADPAYANGLNPLTDLGSFANIKEERFTVPEDALLIILWTSNFAEGLVNSNGDPENVTSYVNARMIAKGYDNCDISRMGDDPIFYKSLSSDEMYGIIEKKGSRRVAYHSFSRQYGLPTYRARVELLDTEESQPNILIRNIMKTYKPELGVRHPLAKYMTELDRLLTVAYEVAILNDGDDDDDDEKKKETPQHRKKKINPPSYWCKQIKLTDKHRADRDQFLLDHSSIATAIKQTTKNKQYFKLILDNPSQEVLEYAVIKFYSKGYKLYAYSILQPVSDTKVRRSPVILADIETEDCLSNSSGSLCMLNSEEAEETLKHVKLQNEVLNNKYDTVLKDVKSMKRQLDVLLVNQRTIYSSSIQSNNKSASL